MSSQDDSSSPSAGEVKAALVVNPTDKPAAVPLSKEDLKKDGVTAPLHVWKEAFKGEKYAMWFIHESGGNYARMRVRTSKTLSRLYSKYLLQRSTFAHSASSADTKKGSASNTDPVTALAFLESIEKERAGGSPDKKMTSDSSPIAAAPAMKKVPVETVVTDQTNVVPFPANSIPLPWSLSTFVTAAMDSGYDVPVERHNIRVGRNKKVLVDFARMRLINYQPDWAYDTPIARIGPDVTPTSSTSELYARYGSSFGMLLKRGEASDAMKESASWEWSSKAAGFQPFLVDHARAIEARFIVHETAKQLLEEIKTVDAAKFSGDLVACCDRVRRMVEELEKVHLKNKNYTYEIDLKALTQKNLSTGHLRTIARRIVGSKPLLTSLAPPKLRERYSPVFFAPKDGSPAPSLRWYVLRCGTGYTLVQLPKRHSTYLENRFLEFWSSSQQTKKTNVSPAKANLTRTRIRARMSVVDVKNMIMFSSRDLVANRLLRVGPFVPNLPPIPTEFPAFMPVEKVTPSTPATDSKANKTNGPISLDALREMYVQFAPPPPPPPSSAALAPASGASNSDRTAGEPVSKKKANATPKREELKQVDEGADSNHDEQKPPPPQHTESHATNASLPSAHTTPVATGAAIWQFGPQSNQLNSNPAYETFEPQVCNALETAYLNFLAARILSGSSSASKTASTNVLDVTHDGVAFQADFATMKIKDVNGGAEYSLQRSNGTGETLRAGATDTITSGQMVVWTWKSSRGGKRENQFDGATSESIEKAYQKYILDGPQASPFVSLAYPNGLPYELDFSKMTQLSVVSGRRRTIQREVRQSAVAPVAGTPSSTAPDAPTTTTATDTASAADPSQNSSAVDLTVTPAVVASQWIWLAKKKQHSFSPRHAEALEKGYVAYNSNPSPTTSTMNLSAGSSTYVIDFKAMMQTNKSTGAQRPIQRVTPTSSSAGDDSKSGSADSGASAAAVAAPPTAAEEPREAALLREEKAAWIGQTSADPASGKQWTADVHKDDKAVYQCMLNKTDIRQNNNKFYFMQLLRERGPPEKWYVFSRYGRVGDAGATHMQSASSAAEAVAMFERKFAEKTSTAWSDRSQFEKKRGKYWLMQIDNRTKEEREASPEGSTSEGGAVVRAVKRTELPSRLSPQVQQLVDFISDRSDMDEAMRRMSIDTRRMPLGRITTTQIKEAYQCLKRIEEELRKPIAAPAVLEDLSSSFYTLVPHVSSGRRALPLIASMVRLQEKVDMLQTLSDLEVASSVLKRTESDAADENKEVVLPHRLDRIYDTLGCHLELLSPSDAVHERIRRYCRNTHGTTHSTRLEVADVFVVKRDVETARYEAERAAINAKLAGAADKSFASPLNTQMLWHGSRKTNFMGILSQGLRIAPPEAPSTGYMFGKGIYMSDVCTKAAGYCHAYNSSKTGLMILSEVALGRMKCYTDAHYMEAAEKGFESTKGLGQSAPNDAEAEIHDHVKWPMGKMHSAKPPLGTKRLSLLYPEYIIYSTAQYRMRYLVRMMFK